MKEILSSREMKGCDAKFKERERESQLIQNVNLMTPLKQFKRYLSILRKTFLQYFAKIPSDHFISGEKN